MVFLGKYLIWLMILLGQLHGYKSCVEKERKALLELRRYIISITKDLEFEIKEDNVFPSWTYNTNCCQWKGVVCNQTSKRVTEIAFGELKLKESSLLNLSLLHPFEEVRSLNLSKSRFSFLYPIEERGWHEETNNQFAGFFDDVEGYKSLGRLRNLGNLDLSSNKFNNSVFPFLLAATSLTTLFLRDNYMDGPLHAKEFKILTNLELLDLSGNRFSGSVPLLVLELSALRKLKALDLSINQFSAPMGSQGYKSLRRLRNLEFLDLSGNEFNNSIFPFFNASTSLTTLFLGSNKMDGPFPAEELKDLTNLELLDLSENEFNGSITLQELSFLRNLKAMDLSDNEFSGSMDLQGICDMENIQELDLSNNKFEGHFPLCLTSLSGLRVIDLSSNQLTGNVPAALRNLKSLKYLSLSDNNFEGSFSLGSLANLSELRVLKIGSRSNSFQVEFESSWKPTFQLGVIELPSCHLVKVPYFLLYQKDLSHIDLSNNKIDEPFPHWLLENNTKLEVLFLQNNSFTRFQLPKSAHKLRYMDVSFNKFSHLLPEDIGWILPQLQYLKLAHNGFKGNLPSSLGNLKEIGYLDMSHNSFKGKLPTSFGNGCYSITLSHNKLSGEVFPESVNFTGTRELSMDNNMFTGEIGQGLRKSEDMYALDISNNRLTGVIPSWIGELPTLYTIMISNNMLEGVIPASLFNKVPHDLLDLSGNMLSGDIPIHANSTVPDVLLLQDNHLTGTISDWPEYCQVLDLRNNRLSGNIPKFNESTSIFTILLRGNNFTGSIPREVCGLRNIQLLDLADNKLSGTIPSCLNNTSFGLGRESFYDYGRMSQIGETFSSFSRQKDFEAVAGSGIYFKARIALHPFTVPYMSNTQIKIEFATKHRYDYYKGDNLQLLFGMDLSKNKLSGVIPTELGVLLELQALNLSHNNLSGAIPKSFSGLKNMESLDLSSNMLQGWIPPQLAELSSLAVFNVSFNNLSGSIPQGRQFNTFDSQSFLGNSFLCGQQTNTSCYNNTSFQEPDNGVEDAEGHIDMISFYWSLAAAYVTILVALFSSLTFDSPWSRFWFDMVDVFIHKVRKLLFCN